MTHQYRGRGVVAIASTQRNGMMLMPLKSLGFILPERALPFDLAARAQQLRCDLGQAPSICDRQRPRLPQLERFGIPPRMPATGAALAYVIFRKLFVLVPVDRQGTVSREEFQGKVIGNVGGMSVMNSPKLSSVAQKWPLVWRDQRPSGSVSSRPIRCGFHDCFHPSCISMMVSASCSTRRYVRQHCVMKDSEMPEKAAM